MARCTSSPFLASRTRPLCPLRRGFLNKLKLRSSSSQRSSLSPICDPPSLKSPFKHSLKPRRRTGLLFSTRLRRIRTRMCRRGRDTTLRGERIRLARCTSSLFLASRTDAFCPLRLYNREQKDSNNSNSKPLQPRLSRALRCRTNIALELAWLNTLISSRGYRNRGRLLCPTRRRRIRSRKCRRRVGRIRLARCTLSRFLVSRTRAQRRTLPTAAATPGTEG